MLTVNYQLSTIFADIMQRTRIFSWIEISLIVLLALVPLFTSFPYRVNIFLSWEGAYRLSEGQVPYRDFGMPLGYMYWVIPALFFKIFGAQLITLVKAQVFINIISGLAFRAILKNLSVQPGIRVLSVLLYCISFSFFNFWPWYNHTVIVYEMIALALLTGYMYRPWRHSWIQVVLSGAFVFFSFFTKQDGGGLALVLCGVLLLYYCWQAKKWIPFILFGGSFILTALLLIGPVSGFNFYYWFNHGQPPHTSRVSAFDLLDEFFAASQWIKFYLLVIGVLVLAHLRKRGELFRNRRDTGFLLLTLGILAEAAILQVTSYTPPDNNIFFHSFAFAFIFSFLSPWLQLDFSRTRILMAGTLGMLLWWSGVFWKYAQRIVQKALPAQITTSSGGENLVTRHTYVLAPQTGEIPLQDWIFSTLPSFHKVYMPRPTAEGMNRVLALNPQKKPDLKVLNMSELTPLALEFPYHPETGSDIPLWYHLGVSMFNREASAYEQKIRKGYYDLVLFEYLPTLNNFYPFRIHNVLQQHYQKIDSFPAPRRGDSQGMIEVYKRPTGL